jgi:hypothetical protein
MEDHLLEFALLHDAALAQHDDMIPEESGFAHVVGNGDRGFLERSENLQ